MNLDHLHLTDLYRTNVNGQIRYFTSLNDMNEEELEYYYDTLG